MAPSLKIGILINKKYKVVKLFDPGQVAQAALVHGVETLSSPFVLRLSVGDRDLRLRKEGQILRRLAVFNKDGQVTGPVTEAAAFVDEGIYDGAYYLVTEYIPLDHYTTVEQAWANGWGETWMMPVCRAFVQFLSKMHRLDIEYWDVKHDHLYWDDSSQQLRVIDFNLCREHASNKPPTWQQRDLSETAIMAAQMLQKSRNWPECKYPLPLPPDWPAPLDVLGLTADITTPTRGVLAWLHGGFYTDADKAVADLQTVEAGLTGVSSSRQGEDMISRRRDQARELVKQACSAIQEGNYALAWEQLQRAWACLPFKRVGADPSDDALAAEVYLSVLRLQYISRDERMLDSFGLWLGGRYDAALVKLAESRHTDAPVALAWLQKRRDIDDRQYALWHEVIQTLREGRHAKALRLCEQYCQEYPDNTEAKTCLEYLQKVKEVLTSRLHWRYDQEDYLYARVMGRVPKRLEERLQGEPRLRLWWQRDEKLQEMRDQMCETVKVTDMAWEWFADWTFDKAIGRFNSAEQSAIKAIELHAAAVNESAEGGKWELQRVIGQWREKAQELALRMEEARQKVVDKDKPDFAGAGVGYKSIGEEVRQAVEEYSRERDWVGLFLESPDVDISPPLPFAAEEFLQSFMACKDSLEGELESTQTKLMQTQGKLNKAVVRIKKLNADLGEQRQLLAEANHEKDQLELRLSKIEKELTAAIERETKLKDDVEKIRSALKKAKEDNDELKKTLLLRQKELEDAQKRIMILETTRTRMQQQLDTALQRIKDLQRELAQKEAELAVAKAGLEELRKTSLNFYFNQIIGALRRRLATNLSYGG